jgi:hypothetical protein
MMNISEKKKWEIAEKLSAKVSDNWDTFASAAGMNKGMIVKQGSLWTQSLNYVNEAINQDKLIDLVEAFTEIYKNDETLKELHSELQNGYNYKLEKLAKVIAEDQCILFLGPGVLKISGTGKVFNDELADDLCQRLNNGNIYCDPDQKENLTYLVQRLYKLPKTTPGEAGAIAKKKFNELKDNDQLDTNVYRKLNKIPWKLIINANPDTILAELINEQNPNSCLVRKYSVSNNVDDKILVQQIINDMDEMDTKKKSFFYNLFGTFDEANSILYTEADFLEFISAVVNKAPHLHSYVTKMFDDKKHYLFLGFDFDQWYFKMLAKVLKLHNKEERALSLNTGGKKFNECNIDFFEQEYKFFFVNDDMNKFLTQLIHSCEK